MYGKPQFATTQGDVYLIPIFAKILIQIKEPNYEKIKVTNPVVELDGGGRNHLKFIKINYFSIFRP